jgi:hypothetical protein
MSVLPSTKSPDLLSIEAAAANANTENQGIPAIDSEWEWGWARRGPGRR